MQRFIKKLCSMLILCLSAASAVASSIFSPDAVLNGTDQSITYLTQLFGQVGASLSTVGSQNFVSTLFSIYNEAVLVLAGIWILYTIYDTLIKVVGKNGQQHMAGLSMKFIKICLGIVMVIPSATTGYCAAQDLAMFAIKQGVALADSTWNAALDYLGSGNVLTPSIESQSSAAIDSTTLSDLGKKTGFFGTKYSSTTTGIPTLINQLVCAIETSTWSSTSSSSLYTESGSAFTFGGSGCGSVSASSLLTSATGSTATTLKEDAISDLLTSLRPAAVLFVCNINASSFRTPAKTSTSYFCEFNATSSATGKAAFETYNESLNSTYIAYASDLISILNAGIASEVSATSTTFDTLTTNMKASGWINTGAYYWAIAGWLQNNGDFGSISGSTIAPGLSSLKGATISASYSGVNYLSSIGSYHQSAAVTCSGQSSCSSLSTLIATSSNALTASQTSVAGSSVGSYPAFSPDWDSDGNVILDAIYDDIQDLYNEFLQDIFDLSNTTPSSDPLILLTVIGFNMINLATSLISAVLTIILVIAAIALFGLSIFGFITNFLGFVYPLLSIVMDILKAISMFLLVVGGTLAIYLPLYPWITWTFAVIGWFFAVIEAMAAAPLICVNLTRPSGQELAGDARKALMMLLSVFLRPVLMVIGFCIAIVLSRVLLTAITHSLAATSLTLLVTNSTTDPSAISTAISSINSTTLNQGYSASLGTMSTNFLGAFNNVRNSTDGFAMLIFQVLFIPTIFALIGYVAYHIISFSFALVFHLPNYVMAWIGGDVAGSGIMGQLQQAAKDSKQAARKGLQEGAKVISAGMGALAGVASVASDMGGKGESEEKNEEEEGKKGGKK